MIGAKNLKTWLTVCSLMLVLVSAAGATTHDVNPGESIQTAINVASNGDEIKVAPGTYSEAINFHGKAIRLYSRDGPGVTIIDASGLNSRVVTCNTNETDSTILEGFTITGGRLEMGGGMYCTGSSPTVINCIFTGNSADGYGGGVYCTGSSPTVINCIFTGNSADEDGGGMYNCSNSNPTVTNCTFRANSVGSWYKFVFGFCDDSCGGGMYNDQSSPAVRNCTFQDNSAWGDGGGMYNYKSNLTVTNCTFTGNHVEGWLYVHGGAISTSWGSLTVTNCILWGNSGGEIVGSANVTYSDVQGGYDGTGNIDKDPMFADDDCRLLSSSQCIDAGDNDAVTVDETDLDGNPRIVDGNFDGNPRADMGAYESVKTLHVPKPYRTIQSEIDAAISGFSEIEVAPGTYKEAINFRGKAIRLYSRGGPEVTIIDATGLNSTVVTCNSGETANTVIEGFTITGGKAYAGGGMFNDRNSSPTVTNCIFASNWSYHGGGMYNAYCSHSTVTNCTFTANTVLYDGGGMKNDGSSNPTVTNCTFSRNAAHRWGGGMYNSESSNPTVTNCILWDDSPDEIIGPATVSFSDVQGGWPGEGNIDENPLFEPGTLRLSAGSPCIDKGDNGVVTVETDLDGNPRIFNGTVDMGAYEACEALATIHVPGDLDTIQSAIDAAISGFSQIEVARGTYYEAINFNGKAIRLYSRDGPNETIIDGGGAYHVVQCVNGEGPDTILEGFTITGGNANGSSPDDEGGGMYIADSSPTVTNCRFAANTAGNGGGMYNTGSSPMVTNCTFSSNQAEVGGGMSNYSSDPTVADCSFSSNTATHGAGGGMRNNKSTPSVAGCTFTGNSADNGGGMGNYSSSPTVADCAFSSNSAIGEGNGGGMHNNSSFPNLTGCTFTANSATRGGGMYNYSSDPTVAHCTLNDNTATVAGGGMRNNSSSPNLTRCSFTGNSAADGGGMHNYSSHPTVAYCTFNSNTAIGDGNGGGMHNNNSLPNLTQCTFTGNSAARGAAMYNWASDHTVTNCTFTGNTATAYGGGMRNNNSTPTVTNCILWGDSGGEIAGSANVTYSDVQGGWTGTGNINDDPLFEDADGRLSGNSPCIDKGDNSAVPADVTTDLDGISRIQDSDVDGFAVVDMGAYETRGIYNVTQGTRWKTIQLAIDSANDGDEIKVALGTYNEAINFRFKAIRLYSRDGPSETIIDAGGLNSTVVTCNSGENANTILEGFTITGGRGYRAGGMLNDNHSSPTVINCIFTLNWGEYGGGMYNAYGSHSTVTNCVFQGNETPWLGGGMLNKESSPTVTNCTFLDNGADLYGGGMYNESSNPDVTNCTFARNSASSGGGMLNRESSPTVTNCIFTLNWGEYGGGLFNMNSSSPTLTNCTFSGNSAEHGGGMYNLRWNSPTVTNCILWGDSPDEISGSSYSSPPTVAYSNVQGGWMGTGNIDPDPEFADADGRLSCNSPCIDAGDNSAVPGDIATDLDGDPRFADFPGRDDTGSGTPPIVDMGAYEYVWADADADGIEDSVDTQLDVCSNDFADGLTTGTIIDRADQLLVIADAPDPCGVRISASGGTEPAQIDVRGEAQLRELDDGDVAFVTCGSVYVAVVQGTVEIVFTAADGTQAETSLNAGNAIAFEPEICIFAVPPTNVDDAVVIVDGGEIILAPGQSKLMAVNVADFGILALNGGALSINSATSIIGDVGYSSGVTSETNQKVTLFDGAALVHSQVQAFSYTEKNFAPTGGINYGQAVDLKLDKANAEAVDASAHYGYLAPTHILGDLGDDDSVVIESVGHLNVVSLSSLDYKEDSLEFVSREGFNDYFVVNVLGSFDFAASQIVLTGTTPDHVLFNFLGDSGCDIVINKAESVFYGTILGLSANIEYHNPSTFVGAIIGLNINLHSDFNLIHEPFDYPWQ